MKDFKLKKEDWEPTVIGFRTGHNPPSQLKRFSRYNVYFNSKKDRDKMNQAINKGPKYSWPFLLQYMKEKPFSFCVSKLNSIDKSILEHYENKRTKNK